MSALALDVHPVLVCAERVSDAVDAVAKTQPLYMSPADQRAALVALTRAERRLAELKLRVVAAATEACQAEGARDVAGWMSATVQVEIRDARAEQALARAMDTRWQQVAVGMAAGVVSIEQARVIVHGLEALPDYIATDIVARAEAQLVEYATTYRPSELRRLARHILDVIAPEIADEEAAKRLEEDEQRARDGMSLRTRRLGDGRSRTIIDHPDAEQDRLLTFLAAFTSPRKHRDSLGGEEDRIPTTGSSDRRSALFWSTSTPPSFRSMAEMPPPSS